MVRHVGRIRPSSRSARGGAIERAQCGEGQAIVIVVDRADEAAAMVARRPAAVLRPRKRDLEGARPNFVERPIPRRSEAGRVGAVAQLVDSLSRHPDGPRRRGDHAGSAQREHDQPLPLGREAVVAETHGCDGGEGEDVIVRREVGEGGWGGWSCRRGRHEFSYIGSSHAYLMG